MVRARVSALRFQTWFRPIQLLSLDDKQLVLEVPNPFFSDWFEEHNVPLLRDAFQALSRPVPKVRLLVSSAYHEQARDLVPPSPTVVSRPLPAAMEERWSTNLYPRFVFDTFIVGKSNEFSHAAARAVGKEPGRGYNPLFIYGGTGLGKTHLMQAVGHQVLAQNPQARVYYASSEKFMNGMIQAITAGRTAEFRKKYRTLDLLLLDDIHFLSGREATQEEFFHTFNALRDGHKQIVVTSDRPPKDIARIEERLVSRFNSGLVTDIKPPDLETRVAILKRNAERDGVVVPEHVFFMIAERIQSNIRELEGSLMRMSALSRLMHTPVTSELAQEVLRVYVRPEEATVRVEEIQRRVARAFEVTVESLRGKKRTSNIAFARQVGMYLTKELTALTLVEIGRCFGNRDHSTVIYGIEKIRNARANDPELDRKIEELAGELRAPGSRPQPRRPPLEPGSTSTWA